MLSDPYSTLDVHRKAARRLKKAYRSGDKDAQSRVFTHIGTNQPLKHADFLHVIAREAGAESWPKLKFTLETTAMSRDQRAARLKMALYQGQHWRTTELLAGDPALAGHNLGIQIALYDEDAVRAAIDRDLDSATRVIGVRTPILHLAFSKEIHRSPEKRAAMLAIAALLVRHGASVDDGYPAEPGSDHKLSALYGALCHADNLLLGTWLLEQGANPDDNESLYHATELDHTDALSALIRHGANPAGTNALARAIDFRSFEKTKMLLEAGADPDEAALDHPSGQPVETVPALHQAARRWCPAEIAQLLLDHGANATRVWRGHTPYATARIFGNEEVAGLLAEHGARTALSEGEEQLAKCVAGEGPDRPIDPALLNDEDRLLLTRIVFQVDRLDHLKALVAAGLDPNLPDEMGLIPLHAAGWAGLPEAVAFLLTLHPDLDWKNAFGGDALDTVIHGSEHRLDREERDHISCARHILEAGATLHPNYIEECGNQEMAAFLEDWAAATE